MCGETEGGGTVRTCGETEGGGTARTFSFNLNGALLVLHLSFNSKQSVALSGEGGRSFDSPWTRRPRTEKIPD